MGRARLRAIVLALCLVTLVALVPAADARPPGGDCDVKEEYVTHASIGHDPNDPTSGNLGGLIHHRVS